MGRRRMDTVHFTLTLPKPCAEWLDEKVQRRVYATRNHGIELLILAQMEKEGEKK